jgi:hypothetical protein
MAPLSDLINVQFRERRQQQEEQQRQEQEHQQEQHQEGLGEEQYPSDVSCDSLLQPVASPPPAFGIECERSTIVSFNPRVKTSEIPNRMCFSEADIDALFMSVEDYDTVKREALETVELAKSCWVREQQEQVRDDEQHCFLGLEGLSESGRKSRRKRRRRSKKAVLLEQKTQSKAGYFCDELIALYYKQHSETAQEHAVKRAYLNAKDVEEYYSGEEEN